MGLSEIVVILLSLGGFGVVADPAAPSAAEVLKYAPADAELVVHLDVAAVAPRNWQALEKLTDAPAVKASKDAARKIGKLVASARAARAQAKTAAGFDPVTDVQSATGFLTFHGKGEPDGLFVLRGKFPATTLDHIAGTVGGTRSVIEGHVMITSPDGKFSMVQAADGVLIGGTTLLVKERAGAYTPRRSALGDAATPGLDGKPFFYATLRLSPATLLFFSRDVSDPLAIDFFTGVQDLSFGLYWNGLGASFATRTAAGYGRGLLAVDGSVSMLRAGHLYLRGVARLAAAIVDSYAVKSPEVAGFAAHRVELLKLIDESTGDGSFQVAVDKKDSDRRVNLRLTGKSLSDVLPLAGLIVPLGAWGYLSSDMPPEIDAPPVKTSK